MFLFIMTSSASVTEICTEARRIYTMCLPNHTVRVVGATSLPPFMTMYSFPTISSRSDETEMCTGATSKYSICPLIILWRISLGDTAAATSSRGNGAEMNTEAARSFCVFSAWPLLPPPILFLVVVSYKWWAVCDPYDTPVYIHDPPTHYSFHSPGPPCLLTFLLFMVVMTGTERQTNRELRVVIVTRRLHSLISRTCLLGKEYLRLCSNSN